MTGLEMSKSYFNDYGKEMLNNEFPDIMKYLSVGLVGSGSECLGYDDEISSDHDFEPGFCIFIPDESIIDRKTEFMLERAYSRLPKEYMGKKRANIAPVGGTRHGIIRTRDFIKEKTGTDDGILTIKEWISIPEQSLIEVTNGEIFFDNYGEMSKLRENLSYYPEDIRKKKLASSLLIMAQAGQYNYSRIVNHGERASAQLSVFEFVNACINVIFLLNRKYKPYYKWTFKALNNLDILSINSPLLEYLITTDNTDEMYEEKYRVIEGISSDIIDELINQGLSKAICGDLEKHAYSVNDMIEDNEIRNMHILSAI